MREITELFNLLSEPTRLRILNLLFQRALCVCELEEVLQMSQSRISQQLKLLRAANLVIDERDRQWIIYRLQPQPGQFQQMILDTLRQWLEQNEIAKSDLIRLQECMVCGTKRTQNNAKCQNPNAK